VNTAPDFFVYGAPKCGTTALFAYLSEHPLVFAPAIKEPRFFAHDLGEFREVQDANEYARLFEAERGADVLTCDGTPWYLFSRVAANEIKRANPEARIIVVLRNPIEMLHSLYSQYLISFKEDAPDLESAWRLQESRAAGENLPAYAPAPVLLQYGEVARFGSQVERLLGIFPRDQVHITFHEDLVADARRFYLGVLRFLGLPDDGRTDFPVLNERRQYRNVGIAKLISNPDSAVMRVTTYVKRTFGLSQTGILAGLYRANEVPAVRAPLRPEFRRELSKYFRPDVALLEELTQRNLSHWT
jgi:hypothetical protein